MQIATLKGRFVPDHLVGYVVNHHCIDGNRLAGIEQSSGDGADLGLKGDLTKPVVGSGAGGFCVEEDEHLGPFRKLPKSYQKKTKFNFLGKSKNR